MKLSTKIILIIAHLTAFAFCIYFLILMSAFSNNKGEYLFEILLFGVICSVFFAIFYFLFKNIKTYLSITLLVYLFISPIFLMLFYEIGISIYYSILFKEFPFVNDTGMQLYILCSILYLYPIVTSINLKIKNRQKTNN